MPEAAVVAQSGRAAKILVGPAPQSGGADKTKGRGKPRPFAVKSTQSSQLAAYHLKVLPIWIARACVELRTFELMPVPVEAATVPKSQPPW